MNQFSNTIPEKGVLEAVFDGMPVVVRLISRDDIICVLYHRTDDDPTMMMERPLRLIIDEHIGDSKKEGGRLQMLYSKVRIRFDRWMPMTTATMFPIYNDHVISIAPISDQFINSYAEWANQLYDTAQTPEDDATPEEIRNSYFDFLLHNYQPKGKPS